MHFSCRKEYNGNKYYKNPETGFPYTNQWVTFGKKRYYVNGNGYMVSGWQTIANYVYYFDLITKIMVRDKIVDGYAIDANGICQAN